MSFGSGLQVGLRAVIEPELDTRKTEREVKDLEDAMEQAEQLDVDVDASAIGGGIGGGGGLAGAVAGGSGRSGGGGGLGGAAGEAAAGGIAGKIAERAGLSAAAGGGAGGAAAGAGGAGAAASAGAAIAPVALAGATSVGILSGIDKMASASPAWTKTTDMFSTAMELFFRPFGNALSDKFRPMATKLIDFAAEFNQWSSQNEDIVNGLVQSPTILAAKTALEGINKATSGIDSFFSSDWTSGIGTTVADALGDVFGKKISGDDLVDTSDKVRIDEVLDSGTKSVWDWVSTRKKSFWNNFIADDKQRQFWTDFVPVESRNLFGDILTGDTRNIWENYIQGNAKKVWEDFISAEQKEFFADLVTNVPFPIRKIFEGAIDLAERITGIVDLAEQLGLEGDGAEEDEGRPPGSEKADPTDPELKTPGVELPGGGDEEGGGEADPPGSGQPTPGNPVPMASGGLVTRPTQAVVGEAGPEAVIPLDDLRSTLTSGVEQAVASAMMRAGGEGSGGGRDAALPNRATSGGGIDDSEEIKRLLRDISRKLEGDISFEVSGATLAEGQREAHKRYVNPRRGR